MKTEIATCKTFGAKSFANASMFYPKPDLYRNGSIDALVGIRTGPDFIM